MIDSSELQRKTRYLRQLARTLRPDQTGADWQAVREGIDALVCRMVSANRNAYKLFDHQHGIRSAILVPLTESVAALQADGSVFLLESATEWTPLGPAKVWHAPDRPEITMVGVNLPSGSLH